MIVAMVRQRGKNKNKFMHSRLYKNKGTEVCKTSIHQTLHSSDKRANIAMKNL
jgi:hypothetical protein